MKHYLLRTILLGTSALLASASNSFAQADHNGNGGDLNEIKFYDIANDIQAWISQGGAASLVFPSGLNLETYQSKMIEALKSRNVSFTTEKVMVAGVEKTCKNIPQTQQIICNTDRFTQTSEADRYPLVHHEYAGLAGIEVNSGETSNYILSNQLTGSLERMNVLKLVVRKRNPNAPIRERFLQATAPSESFMLNKKRLSPENDTGTWACYTENNSDFFQLNLGRSEASIKAAVSLAYAYPNARVLLNEQVNAQVFFDSLSDYFLIRQEGDHLLIEVARYPSQRAIRRNPNATRSALDAKLFLVSYYECQAERKNKN